MNDFVSTNWPLLVIGALIAFVVLWWVIMATRRTRVSVDRRDTLDEGAERAARNQALIDAAPAAGTSSAPVPPITPDAIGGAGVAVSTGAEDAQIESLASRDSASDDLTRIKGLGPKLAATLAGLGVTRFDQIAAWTDADIDRIDPQLGRFQGRIRRDSWVEQARYLSVGDLDGFQQRFGAQ